MLKTLAMVVAGLAAGFAIAMLWSGESRDAPLRAPDAGVNGFDARRVADLERALLEESERRAMLEQRLDELDAQLAALADARPGAPFAPGTAPPVERAAATATEAVDNGPPPRPPGRQRFGSTPEQRVEQLVSGGFTPQRAQWLMDRAEQLRMEALQAVYDARREGRPLDQSSFPDEQTLLRSEIGDPEYEQFLTALGRPTAVGVGQVFASSPAEAAGLRPGDEIVSYAGSRVFDMRDLNRLTYEGEPGQPVVVEVRRDGQQLQVVLPRGPVGITAGRFGGRP